MFWVVVQVGMRVVLDLSGVVHPESDTYTEFLSMDRTSSSALFGVEIYWRASIFGARTIGRFSINVSSIDTPQHYTGAGYGESERIAGSCGGYPGFTPTAGGSAAPAIRRSVAAS